MAPLPLLSNATVSFSAHGPSHFHRQALWCSATHIGRRPAAPAQGEAPNAAPLLKPTPRSDILHRLLLGALGAAALTGAVVNPARAEAPTQTPTGSSSSFWPFKEHAAGTMESKQPPPDAHYLSPEEINTIRIFQQTTPAVVNVSNIIAARLPFTTDLLRVPQGQGSGFVWDSQGHVVTNFHVIEGANEVRVVLLDQTVLNARVVGADPSKDVAVLQLDAPKEVLAKLRPMTVGESSGLFVGQRVLAIGNPFGLDHTLTQGIISGLNRELDGGRSRGLRNMIQTDAAYNPGTSGGPLLDSRGRLIGINTAIADPSGRGVSSGVGFAIPIDSVRGLVEQILKYGRVVRPVLGVVLAPPQVVRQLGLEGVLVLGVSPGGAAAQAGLEGMSRDAFGRLSVGDVIVGINGRAVKTEGDLYDILDSCKVGDEVTVDILRCRKGKEKASLKVKLMERAPEPAE